MALQLPMINNWGDAYPTGYRRLDFFAISVNSQSIVAVFNDYKSKAIRDADPLNFFRQTTYRIIAEAQPEVTDDQGNVISAAQPAFADFLASDNANPLGVGATVYGFAKAQPDNADAVDV